MAHKHWLSSIIQYCTFEETCCDWQYESDCDDIISHVFLCWPYMSGPSVVLLESALQNMSNEEHVKWRTCQLLCVCVWVPHTHTLLLRFIWMIKMCASSECCMRTNLMTIAGVYQHHCAAALGLVDPGPHGCLWWRITSACPLSQLQQRGQRQDSPGMSSRPPRCLFITGFVVSCCLLRACDDAVRGDRL